MFWLLAAAATVAVVGLAVGQSGQVLGGDVTVVRDLRYDRSAGSSPERHVLDLFLPAGLDQYPFVVFLHGGGWVSGDKNERPGELYDNVGRVLAGRGVGVALANYRLSDGSGSHVVHPGHVEDVARVLAFVRAYLNSRGVDPSDLYVIGHDAGAHLAALAVTNRRYLAAEGLAPADVRGVVGLSGIYRIDPAGDRWTDVFGADPDTRRDASPIDHIAGDEPPFLLLYADADLAGRDDEAIAFGRELRRAGTEAMDLPIADRDHESIVSSIGRPGDVTTALILHFVSAHADRTPTPTRTVSPTPTSTVVPTATSGPAAQPPRPNSGPGGSDPPHAGAVAQLVERDGSRFWLLEPRDPNPASAPMIVFVGSGGAGDRNAYSAWLDHIARSGAIVVFADLGLITTGDPGEVENAVEAVYRAALAELTEAEGDHTQPIEEDLIWVGHGRGAMVAARLAASWFERRLPAPKALMMLMPRRLPGAWSVLRRVPRDTKTLLVLAEDDPGRDADLERDIWRGLAEVPGAWRQSLRLRSDRHGTPALIADFETPYAGLEDLPFPEEDAHDWFGPWKWLDALASCALRHEACAHALGDTTEQRFMGLWSDGVPVLEPEVAFGPPLELRREALFPTALKR